MGLNIAKSVFEVAVALRQSLIELSNLRSVQQGQETKMEQVYQYLTGMKFRQHRSRDREIQRHARRPRPGAEVYGQAVVKERGADPGGCRLYGRNGGDLRAVTRCVTRGAFSWADLFRQRHRCAAAGNSL